jgi:hypothetical protein
VRSGVRLKWSELIALVSDFMGLLHIWIIASVLKTVGKMDI